MDAGFPDRALRRRAGYAGDRRGNEGGGRDKAQAQHGGVIWIDEMVDKPSVIELYSRAAVFCCPSIYEPFGIINLEAMACETAVVATAVGGIKEVVVDGETGFLVPVEQMKESPFEPREPEKFSRDLAARINQLMADPDCEEVRARRAETRGRKIRLARDRAGDEGALRAINKAGSSNPGRGAFPRRRSSCGERGNKTSRAPRRGTAT